MCFSETDHQNYLAARTKLRAFCITLTRGHIPNAEDLCQEAMMKAWLHSDRFKPGTNMGAWLGMIALNAFRSEYRKAKRMQYAGDAADAESLGDKFDVVTGATQLKYMEYLDVMAEFNRLPEEQKNALTLLSLGETYEDTARKTRCAVGTVKSRIHRARNRLEQANAGEAVKRKRACPRRAPPRLNGP